MSKVRRSGSSDVKRTRRAGAGRPPKPTVIKQLQGTDQPCRSNPKEPKQKCEVPKQVIALSAEGKRAWTILADVIGPEGMRVCTKADVFGMTMFCQAWSGYVSARRELANIGSAYKSYEEKVTKKAGKAKDNGKHAGGKPKTISGKINKIMWKTHPLAKLAGEERAFLMDMLSRFGLTPSDRKRVDEISELDEGTPEGKLIAMGKKRRAG